MDLSKYIARYSGFSRVQRLELIASESGKDQDSAVELALREVMENNNSDVYQRLFKTFPEAMSRNNKAFDSQWVAKAAQTYKVDQASLEHEVTAARASVIKENIRTACLALGDFYYNRGEFAKALKQYSRSRDYCSNAQHNITTILKLMKSSVGNQNLQNVHTLCSRGFELLGPKSSDTLTLSKLNACLGLALLHSQKYDRAAEAFSKVGSEIRGKFSDVLSCEDVALYGGLCAIASTNRDQVRSMLLQNPSFKVLLEAMPEVRRLLDCFVSTKYASCVESLKTLEALAKLDLHLRDYSSDIFHRIRTRVIVQYVYPFSTIKLPKMAEDFAMTGDQLETTLMSLIVEKTLNAKIDSENGYLIVARENLRDSTHARAVRVGENFCFVARSAILHHKYIKSRLLDTERAAIRQGDGAGSNNDTRSQRGEPMDIEYGANDQ